jgi:acyl-[acyl-carrier protein] desaturase
MRTQPPSDGWLLDELAPVVERNLDRHLASAEAWMPHGFVPFERGRNYAKEPWEPSDSELPEVARAALEVNLLTEDNLPYYHLSIWDAFGRHEAWSEWVRRWTAEEGRHAIVLRDYLMVTRGVDPDRLEIGRMEMVQRGWYPEFARIGPLDAIAYTAVQELATRISHRNTGAITGDETAVRLTARVATDENLHHVFYRDLTAAALAIDPSATMLAIARQVVGFAMPGSDMSGFAHKARAMARAGIYNLRIHLDQVLRPLLLARWRVDRIDGLSDEAQRAREDLLRHLERVDRVATRLGEPSAPTAEPDVRA